MLRVSLRCLIYKVHTANRREFHVTTSAALCQHLFSNFFEIFCWPVFVVSRLLHRPLRLLGRALRINETSALCLLSSLASSSATFGMMKSMDERGTVLNAAFAVSGAFVFAGHLAFTVAFDPAYVPAMVVGKLVGGVLALLLAIFISSRTLTTKEETEA